MLSILFRQLIFSILMLMHKGFIGKLQKGLICKPRKVKETGEIIFLVSPRRVKHKNTRYNSHKNSFFERYTDSCRNTFYSKNITSTIVARIATPLYLCIVDKAYLASFSQMYFLPTILSLASLRCARLPKDIKNIYVTNKISPLHKIQIVLRYVSYHVKQNLFIFATFEKKYLKGTFIKSFHTKRKSIPFFSIFRDCYLDQVFFCIYSFREKMKKNIYKTILKYLIHILDFSLYMHYSMEMYAYITKTKLKIWLLINQFFIVSNNSGFTCSFKKQSKSFRVSQLFLYIFSFYKKMKLYIYITFTYVLTSLKAIIFITTGLTLKNLPMCVFLRSSHILYFTTCLLLYLL